MSIAFFAQGMTAYGWVINSDIASSNLVGVAGGILNFVAILSGSITLITVYNTHSFTGCLKISLVLSHLYLW